MPEPSRRPNSPPHTTRERLVTTLVWSISAVVVAMLLWILGDVALRGLRHLTPTFFYGTVEDAGRAGGIGPLIISTVLILSIAIVAALPVALATAMALTERDGRDSPFTRTARHALDVLAGVPSIVFGLFGNALFVVALGMGYSILSGGLTLACMVLPILVRTTEQAIRDVPAASRYGAAALGLTRWATLRRVVFPAAAPAILAGVVLALGRAIAETAALIFTAGYVTRTPDSLLDSGRALSVHIFDLAMNVPGGTAPAYATACVLVLLLLMINAVVMSLPRISRWTTGADQRPWRRTAQ